MSGVGGQIDQIKLDRLTAAAQGGSEGLKQYDAAQASLASERAGMAAGLAGDAKSAGYAGPSLGGAPTVLSGQLNSGLDPYQQALASGRQNFTQDLQQGTAASMRYLDAVKAAEAAGVAARGSGGGGGGGGGGSGGGSSISNTTLFHELVGAAAQLRAAQLAAISRQGSAVETQTDSVAKNQQAVGQRVAEYKRFEQPDGPHFQTVPGPLPPTGSLNPNGQQNPPPLVLKNTTPATPFAGEQANLDRRIAALRQLSEVRLPQQYQSTFLTPPSGIIAQSPEITSALAQAGIDPGRVAQVLTPQTDRTWLNAEKGLLPKSPAVAAVPKGKAIPVPYQQAAAKAGIAAQDLPTILGQTYLKDGYQAVDPNTGKPVPYGTKGATYLNDTGKGAGAHSATGNLATDLISQAQTAAGRGYDYMSFWQSVDASPFWNRVFKASPANQYVFRLAQAVSGGLFNPTPAQPAIPSAPVVPLPGYYSPPVGT